MKMGIETARIEQIPISVSGPYLPVSSVHFWLIALPLLGQADGQIPDNHGRLQRKSRALPLLSAAFSMEPDGSLPCYGQFYQFCGVGVDFDAGSTAASDFRYRGFQARAACSESAFVLRAGRFALDLNLIFHILYPGQGVPKYILTGNSRTASRQLETNP